MKKIICLVFILVSNISYASSGGGVPLIKQDWPFEGYLGHVDKRSAQRGFQVYKEVCASCHALSGMSYRNLEDLGFSEDEVKTIAAEYTVTDGPNDDGDMFERKAIKSDYFVAPFPNENAARAANAGAYPPDLTLIVKARPDGANYLYSLLNGYANAPSDFKMAGGMNYNLFFPGHQIAMPKPLSNDQVSYQDGTIATVQQMSRDLVNFLQWTAEPEMEQRKKMGLKTLLFLAIATIFFYIAKKRIWSDVK